MRKLRIPTRVFILWMLMRRGLPSDVARACMEFLVRPVADGDELRLLARGEHPNPAPFGNIRNWDVSFVVDFDSVFHNNVLFDEPIGYWDMRRALTMRNMFRNACSFNQPLTNWNLCRVKHIEGLFYNARSFNQSVSRWVLRDVHTWYKSFAGTIRFAHSLPVRWIDRPAHTVNEDHARRIDDMFNLYMQQVCRGLTHSQILVYEPAEVTMYRAVYGETPSWGTPPSWGTIRAIPTMAASSREMAATVRRMYNKKQRDERAALRTQQRARRW